MAKKDRKAEGMNTKVVKFEIVGIKNEDKKLMRKILTDLQWDSRNQGNDVIKCLYENSRFGTISMMEEYGFSLNHSLQGNLNALMKIKYTKANSSGTETIVRKVMSEWSTNQKKHYIGDASIISYRNSNAPLYVRNNQIKLIQEDNKYYVAVRLLSKTYANELEKGLEIKVGKGKDAKTITYKKNTEGQWLQFEVIVKGNLNKPVFDRVLSGEYLIGTSQFLHLESKKKWMFYLTYSFPKKEVVIDENVVMGIDVGISKPATIAVSNNDGYFNFVGDGKDIEDMRNQVEGRKKRIQKSRRYSGEGSVGHGTKCRLKALDKVGNKISNFKATKNHQFSSFIVKEAVKLGVGVIQMEDLSGISETDSFLKTWTYYDLQTKIEYKAKEVGIEVKKVKPKYTSSRCNKCGHVHMESSSAKYARIKSGKKYPIWRPTQEQFHCQNCNHKANADVNAAKNIAMKDIDKIIEKQVELQNKHSKHTMKYLVD